MRIQSSEFLEGQSIPKKFTCDGEDINPPLLWNDVPAQAKSLVLICEDPDAPNGTFIHWIVFNIPPHVRMFSEGIHIDQVGGREGTNSFGNQNFGGPCPPSGVHRYYFKLYALDIEKINLPETAKIDEVRAAMKGHILDEAECMGRYGRVE